MRRDNLDSRIALANRIGADDLAILPGIMTTFDKAESDPVTKGRRMGNGCDPACTVARDLVRGTQDSAGVEDLPSVTWERCRPAVAGLLGQVRAAYEVHCQCRTSFLTPCGQDLRLQWLLDRPVRRR